MKIAVVSHQDGVGRQFVYSNLVEVLADSRSMECIDQTHHEMAINEADYIVLVTGNTIDRVEALKELIMTIEAKGKAYGVLINKVKNENNEMKDYCFQSQIKVLENIPFDEEVSRYQDNNRLISRENEEFRIKFLNVLNNIYIHMANMIYQLKTEDSEGCGDH